MPISPESSGSRKTEATDRTPSSERKPKSRRKSYSGGGAGEQAADPSQKVSVQELLETKLERKLEGEKLQEFVAVFSDYSAEVALDMTEDSRRELLEGCTKLSLLEKIELRSVLQLENLAKAREPNALKIHLKLVLCQIKLVKSRTKENEEYLSIHCTPDAENNLNRRHVAPPKLAPLPKMPETFLKGTKLPIFHGESGSGKTVLMLRLATAASDTTIYVTGYEIFGEEDIKSDALKEARDFAVKQKLVAALGSFFEDHQGNALSTSIVIDEMGGFPVALRGLCRVWKTVTAEFQTTSHSKSVKMFVGGTGCSSLEAAESASSVAFAAPGSSDDSFEVMLVDRTALDLKKVYPDLHGRLTAGEGSSFLRAVALLENGRSGVCLCQALERMIPRSGKISLGAIDAACTVAAARYRELNALSRCPEEDLPFLIGRALWLTMWRIKEDLQTLPSVRAGTTRYPWNDQLLVTNYGVVVDNKFPAADRPRYTISQAQCQLFLMRYGLDEHVISTGEGFEHQVKDYLVCLLSAGRAGMVPLQGILDRLCGKSAATTTKTSTTTTKGAASMSSGEPLPDPLCIVIKQPSERIQPPVHGADCQEEAYAEIFTDCNRLVAQGKIVIVLNGAQASFADILVFFPGGTWLLIQAKRYLGATLQEYEVYHELAKMGLESKKSIAGLAAKSASCAILKDLKLDDEFVSGKAVKRALLYDSLNKSKSPLKETAKVEVQRRHEFRGQIAELVGVNKSPMLLFFCAGKSPHQFKIDGANSEFAYKFVQIEPETTGGGSRLKAQLLGKGEISHNGLYPLVPATSSTPTDNELIVFRSHDADEQE